MNERGPRLTVALVALVLALTFAGAVFGGAVLLVSNSVSVEDLDRLRGERVRESALGQLDTCRRNNAQDRLLASLLAAVLIPDPDEPPPTAREQESRRIFRRSLEDLRQSPDCWKQPIVRGAIKEGVLPPE